MADQILHNTNTVVDSSGLVSNAALANSGVTSGEYTSNNTHLLSFEVDAKGRITTASTPTINVTGVTFANTNASGTPSSAFAHTPNQKVYISSSAPSSNSIGNNGDIWYQTLT
jgi:hypothetical protein